MKKTGVLLCVVLTVLLVLTGCGKKDSGTTSASASTSSSKTAETGFVFDGTYPLKTDGPVTITFWTPMIADISKLINNYGENLAYQELQKRVGVEIKFIHPPVGSEPEAFNLLMASGELPDIIAAPELYPGGAFQGLQDGVFADLTDLLPVYAPEYWKIVQEHDDFRKEVSNSEGRIPLYASYKVPGDPPFRRMVMKQENLDAIGETVPVLLEDYERIFQKFLDAGVTPYLLDKTGVEEQFVNLFGVHANEANQGKFLYRDLDGVVHYAPYEPGFKQYLELMNDWYKKGYISKDFPGIDPNQAKVLFDTNKIGMMVDAVVGTFNRVNLAGETAVSAPAVRLYEGQDMHYERNDATPVIPNREAQAVISASSKNKEIALAVLNYFYTEEGAELLNWGIEGVNWDWVDGKRVYNDTMLNNPKMNTEMASYYYKMHFAPKLNYPDTQVHANLLKSPDALAIRMKYSDDEHMDSKFVLPNIQYTESEQDEATKIQVDLDTYVREMILKFIVGAESFDNYDKFLNTQKQLGVEKLVAITQAAYDRYQSK